MSDPNLGNKGTNPVNAPATSYLKNIPAVDATAIANQHGSHVPTDTNPVDPAIFTSDQKLGDGAAALGDKVVQDGFAELGKVDAHGSPAPKF
jgi:hypothetical protein